MTTRSWMTLVLLVPVACVDRGSDAAAPATRDSAGIQIVESAGPSWTDGTRWRLSDQPTLQLGAGADGQPELQFAYVSGVHRLASGTIAVVDRWAPAILFFDSAGALLGRIGRRGSGPGEFPPYAALPSYACGGDSLYVGVNERMSVYVPPGVFVRTFLMQPMARVRACNRNGLIAQLPHGGPRNATGMFTDSLKLAWYDRGGIMQSVIDSLPIQENDWTSNPGSSEASGYMPVLFGHKLSLTASDSLLATGFATTFQVDMRNAEGKISRLLRMTPLDRKVGDEDINRFRDFVFNPWGGNEVERVQIEQRLAEARGRVLPSFAELRVDGAGNIWARAYDHLDAVSFFDYSHRAPSPLRRPQLNAPRRWHILSADGRYLGELSIPQNFTVHQIGIDWILGVWRDELDIPFVRQYGLIKPAA